MKIVERGSLKLSLAFLGLLAMAMTSCEQAQPEHGTPQSSKDTANVAGEWVVTMKPSRGGGLHQITLTMEQKGNRLTGTWIPKHHPDRIYEVTGTVDRNEVSLTIALPDDDTILVTGLVDHDLMLGRFKLSEDDPGLELKAERGTEP